MASERDAHPHPARNTHPSAPNPSYTNRSHLTAVPLRISVLAQQANLFISIKLLAPSSQVAASAYGTGASDAELLSICIATDGPNLVTPPTCAYLKLSPEELAAPEGWQNHVPLSEHAMEYGTSTPGFHTISAWLIDGYDRNVSNCAVSHFESSQAVPEWPSSCRSALGGMDAVSAATGECQGVVPELAKEEREALHRILVHLGRAEAPHEQSRWEAKRPQVVQRLRSFTDSIVPH